MTALTENQKTALAYVWEDVPSSCSYWADSIEGGDRRYIITSSEGTHELTRSSLIPAMRKLHETKALRSDLHDYLGQFLTDFDSDEDTDHDSEIVDTAVQQALFGEVVFG